MNDTKGRYGWPRLMPRQLAAAYCGVSVNHFLAHVPVAPRALGTKALWDRRDIDTWLDSGAEKVDNWDKALEGV